MVPDGLEAVPDSHYPEVVPSTKETYYAPSSGQYSGVSPAQQPLATQHAVPPPPTPEKKILGVRRTTFILSLILLIVVIAAGVGGGLGGSMAVTNAYKYV